MRENKKIYIIAVVLIFVINTLVFFWPTPVRQDLKNLREHYDILRENFQAMSAEVDTWNTSFQGDNLQYSVNTLLSDFQYGVNNVIVPKVDNSITILNMTELSTPEVITLRDQYVSSLEAFRDGSEIMLESFKNNDEKLYKEAEALLLQSQQGMQAFYDNYKALAKEKKFIYFD